MAFNTNGATGAFQGFVPKPQSNTTSNQNMSSIQSALTNAQKTGAVTNVPNRTPQPGLMSPAYSPTGKANFAPAPISTPAPSSMMQPKAPVTTGVANTTPTVPTTTPTTPTPAATTTTSTPTTNITYPGLISGLASTAQGNKDIAQQAIETAQKYGAQYADVGQQGAGLRAGQLTTGTSPVGEGNAAITAQTIAAQQQALAQGGQLALQGTGQALTGQAQTQSGLQQAAALAAPTTGVPYGTQVYNPITGQFQSGGSAFQGGQVAGEKSLGEQYTQNVSANNQAAAVKNQIVSFLNTTPINPSDFTDINSILGLFSGKVSDPKYAQLSNMLAEYANTLTPILGVGGDNTNLKTTIAQGMLNGRMSPQAISDTLNNIEQIATAKLNQQQYGGQSTVGGVASPTGTTPTGSTSGTLPSGASFKLVNGVYVKS